MEYCGGGELAAELLKVKKFSEVETKKIMSSLASAIAYLHKSGKTFSQCLLIFPVRKMIIGDITSVIFTSSERAIKNISAQFLSLTFHKILI